MIVPFKIALITAVAATSLWFTSGLVFRAFGSPFPQIMNKADHVGGAMVWLAVLCALTAIVATIVGVISL